MALGLWILREFLPALVWATVFAVATWPLYSRFVRFIHGEGHPSILAPMGFTLLVGLVFLVPVALLTIELGREALFVARFLPSIDETGLPVPAWVAEVPRIGSFVAQWWQANLADPHAAAAMLGRLDRGVVIEWIQTLGRQLARRSTVLIFTLLTLFFLYRDGQKLVSDLEALTLRLVGPQGRRVGVHMVHAVRGTVNGLVFVGMGEGAVLGFAYVLLGVPHPVLFGGMTAVLGMISRSARR